MQFTKSSASMIKPLLPLINKCGSYSNHTKKSVKSLDKVLLKLYNDIEQGNQFVNHMIDTDCFQPTITAVRDMPKTYDSRYFPENIKVYIRQNIKYQLTYQCKMHDRDIKIVFALFTSDDLVHIGKYNKHARFIYIWLYICDMYSLRECSQTMTIYLYLTPMTKTPPTSNTVILGPEHVNTAFTYRCQEEGEIILYREEEWMKVLIHETFHSFNFDFGDYKYDYIKQKLQSIFPVDSNFKLYETYTETWARIINAGFVNYALLKDKADKDTFLLNMKFSLELERLFSLQQLIRVLQFMGLRYVDLYKKGDTHALLRTSMYRENTNVLVYYILSGILMNDYVDFLKWCLTHNVNMYKFDVSPHNITSFLNLFKKHHDSDTLKETLECIMKQITKTKKPIVNSMRMSALEIV